MYKCEDCTKLVKFDKFKRNSEGKRVRDSAFKVIAKTRDKTYEHKFRKGKKVITKQGKGWEIAKEKLVCRKCVKGYSEELRVS